MSSILRSHYVLAVPDLDRSQAWYEGVLGCSADVVDPGNWVFMQRDVVVFQLGRCPDAIAIPTLGDHQYFAYLVVDDVDAWHDRAAANIERCGGDIRKAPQDEPWGMREMALQTVDGHRLMLGQNIGRASEPWPVANSILRVRAMLGAQRALLGNVPATLRRVSLVLGTRAISLHCVFDSRSTVEERELMSDVEAELVADFEEPVISDLVVEVTDGEVKQIDGAQVIFARFES